MPSRHRRSPVAAIAAFAVATAAVTLAVGWPATTHADGDNPLAQYSVDGWKIGDVVAKGEIKRDASSKTGWTVTITARNDADHPADLPLETDVTRLSMSPMARAAPFPATVWSTREQVTIPARGSVTRRYPLPAELAAAMSAAPAAKKVQPQRGRMPAPIVSFAVAFDRNEDQARQRAVPPGQAPQVAD